jgi:hypothetical protein
MKIQSLILSSAILAVSCNSQPKADISRSDSTNLNADTIGLAAYQQWKAQNELTGQNTQELKENKSSSKTIQEKNSDKTGNTSPTTTTGNSSSGTSEKNGWSKTAKGAVIGGVAGAAGGAIINKKNRAAGAVIGGVIGAGTGAVIGNEIDKKDGRH